MRQIRIPPAELSWATIGEAAALVRASVNRQSSSGTQLHKGSVEHTRNTCGLKVCVRGCACIWSAHATVWRRSCFSSADDQQCGGIGETHLDLKCVRGRTYASLAHAPVELTEQGTTHTFHRNTKSFHRNTMRSTEGIEQQ